MLSRRDSAAQHIYWAVSLIPEKRSRAWCRRQVEILRDTATKKPPALMTQVLGWQGWLPGSGETPCAFCMGDRFRVHSSSRKPYRAKASQGLPKEAPLSMRLLFTPFCTYTLGAGIDTAPMAGSVQEQFGPSSSKNGNGHGYWSSGSIQPRLQRHKCSIKYSLLGYRMFHWQGVSNICLPHMRLVSV